LLIAKRKTVCSKCLNPDSPLIVSAPVFSAVLRLVKDRIAPRPYLS
jgi:hypothetical protein